ncbi:MAG: putative acyltransferase family protein [Cyanobacteria bacterium RYN_339]|nr:putative acyltransferase family protein [Cyanobacteria bacterium RYN_339]
MSHPIHLMTARRFAPLFWAQFLGAFNDNFLKNAIIMLIAYKGLAVWGMSPDAMGTFAPALFIAPYFLFSAIAGQLADRLPKTSMIRYVKGAEVGLAILAAVGFLADRPQLLLICLFLLGLQATFFGPLKYSILPQLLSEDELVTGNALVEMGTNLAILLGTLAGGILVAIGGSGPTIVGVGLVLLALTGWISSTLLPATPAQAPDLEVSLNPVSTTWRICADVAKSRPLWNAILANSWFWLYGFAILGLFVPYAKNSLHAGENVVTLFLAVFSVGVAVGSIVCEKLSFDRLELGLVPLGSIGMTIFALDMCFAGGLPALSGGALMGVDAFIHTFTGQRLVFDMFLLAMCGGFYIVPLYTFLQARAEPSQRSRVIAANNVVNAVFIVIWAGIQIWLLSVLTVPQIFLLLGVLNALVAVYIYTVIPEFFLRFVAYLLTHLIYRCKVTGFDQVPREGGAVIVCNHVSFIDWLIIAAAVKRPARFVMYNGFAKIPLLGGLFARAKVIPIASHKEDPEALHKAMDRIAEELEAGEVVCIFPEGKLTGDGAMNEFRPGIERIIARTPVPVIPCGLQGLWGSYFSRKDGHAMTHPFRRFWSRISLVFGEPVQPAQVTAEGLHDTVLALRGDKA